MSRLITSLLPLFGLASAAIPAHEITSLPGWNGDLPSRQFSGYIQVDSTAGAGRFLHYWLIESEGNPSTDPLVLWLNGGPGCSSLDGFLYELGPIHFGKNKNGTLPELVYNPYTWAKNANIVFLESPSGVGFSYTESLLHINSDDETAQDNYQFLLNFYQSYPEYNSTFFIAGESYAGIYIPTLVNQIMLGNDAGRPFIPLEGFMVGNGCYGNSVGACSMKGDKNNVDFLYGHDLFSSLTHNAIESSCGDFSSKSLSCSLNLLKMGSEVSNVNIYDIFDDCINGDYVSKDSLLPQNRALRTPYHTLNDQRVGGPVGCIDGIDAGAYLNDPSVQKAIHVNPKNWQICANLIYTRNTDTLIPLYPTLIKRYRTLIFNGDTDACVPVTDNAEWTSSLGFPVKDPWHAWSLNNQVQGYATVYDVNNFTFLTVKGAGHMVPEYKPAAALEMFQRFINNQPF